MHTVPRRRGSLGPGTGELRNRNEALRAFQGTADLLVYAVRTSDGLIKIGGTARMPERLTELGATEILALRHGTREDEMEIHRALKGYSAHGREFYPPLPKVLAIVNDMRADLGLDPIAA